MDSIISDFNQSAKKNVDHLKEDLKAIRTGRASPALVENLIVETYQGQAKLRLAELSSITTEGPLVLSITPFDPSVLQDIEKAVLKSTLGFNPQVQGSRILIAIPALSEEQREKFIKLVGQKVEEKKNQIRAVRDDGRRKIKGFLESKEITEDDKFRMEKEIDNLTTNYMNEIIEVKERKEQEIREV